VGSLEVAVEVVVVVEEDIDVVAVCEKIDKAKKKNLTKFLCQICDILSNVIFI